MKKIGIGYENYKEFIDEKLYYVDKTMLVRDIIEKGGKVTLFTRPRRFGKTLMLSMLRTFFEAEYDRDGNAVDKSRYFAGMKIMDEGESILSMMGKYPVIKLSLKSAKQPSFFEAGLQLREEIAWEVRRHEYLLRSDRLSEEEKRAVRELSELTPETALTDEELKRQEISRYRTALKTLSLCLKKHHDRNVIILLDEYDVPLENAYYSGFYPEMIGFIRSLFESALKTNEALQFAVVTGCLRISRESIFTGMNHLVIESIRNKRFAEGFGFTPQEVKEMLHAYELDEKEEEVRKWYDGYLFGDKEVYNPWSVISYIYNHIDDRNRLPEPYWSNTSSNQIIHELVEEADEETKREIDRLIEGGTIEKPIHEEITYGDIHRTKDNLWNFLFFTGYLKKVSERQEGNEIYVTMKLPNREVGYIYENQIREWFDRTVRAVDHSEFYRAVLDGDTDKMSAYLTGLLRKTISTFDSAEGFYHGFFLSLLYGVPDYGALSNREAGNGRPDITLYPDRPEDPAILFEVKTRKRFSDMQDGLAEAFRQIRDQNYAEGILDEGYIGSVAYGVCFCKKSCVIGRYPGEG